jgi:chromosomal replication initiator protein
LELNEIWSEVLKILKEDVHKVAFSTWYEPLKIIAYKNNTVYLETANEFFRNMVSQRHHSLLKNSFEYVLKQETELIFTIPGDDIEKMIKHKQSSLDQEFPDEEMLSNRKLNIKYKFDNFIVGSGNRFAHAASLAVAEAPAITYNPLYLYGGVGLGKTHLMHAIGHYILDFNPNAKVLYVTSEKFMNDLINSIQNRTTEAFRNKYREIDVLLVDDIQFIAGKESTQEEFFHTFNALHQSNKQIIISSDNPPSEIPTLEDRLRSRFEWGLIADIQAPDFETRIAILRKKAEIEKYNVPDEVITYIGQNIQSNIRKLEGALIRLVAYSSLYNKEINVELAQEALKNIVSANKKITIKEIQDAISNYYNVSLSDLKSKGKSRNIAYPRQIAMYIAKSLTDESFPSIGNAFGGRDHSTVIHANNKIKEELITNSVLKKAIDDIIAMINN